jgi:hypothetical protein
LVNLKDNNDNAPFFPHGVYFGNVTENGTAGMVVMTMTAVNYDDPNEGSNAKLTYSIEKNVMDEKTGMPIFEIESETGVIKTAVPGLDREKTPDYSIQVVAMDGKGLKVYYLLYLTLRNTQQQSFFTFLYIQEREQHPSESRISTTCRQSSPNLNGTLKLTRRTASHYRTLLF